MNPELRSTKIALQALHALCLNNTDFSCMVQSNFRGFDKSVYEFYKNPVLLDQVKYSEEQLVLNESDGKAFKVIEHLDGLRFYFDP